MEVLGVVLVGSVRSGAGWKCEEWCLMEVLGVVLDGSVNI
jgi:hypothetical protein